ncbi:alpha/beta fold hydrolase [Chloroflexota bacterium]
MPKVRVNDIELYYEVHGQGYPVVFQHGFGATVSMWQPQVPVLSREYQFVIYDARGHGQSESPPSPDQYSADIVVEDLFQLLRTLGIEKAVVGGLSMGGYDSLRFYLRHPQMVTALIAMDTGPGYRNPTRREEWNRQREEAANLLETQGTEAHYAAGYTPSYITREVFLKQNPTGLAHMARKVVGQHDSWVIENLGEIKVPTLVLVGEEDTPFLQSAEYMSKAIPGAQHVVIPKAGHGANLDNVEAFNKAILDFLRKLNLPKG